MPTGEEYRDLARRCEQMIDDLLGLARPVVHADVDPFVTGPLATLIVRTVDATQANLHTVLTELDAIAVEGRTRASVCDRYRAEVNDFRRADARYRQLDAVARSSTPQPVAPRRPFPWADS